MIDMKDLESLDDMNDFRINKVAHYLPANIVDNSYFEARLDTNDEWIQKRTGIKTRHFATNEAITKMIANGLDNLNLNQSEIDKVDLVIVATSSNKKVMPNLSAFVQGYLKLKNNVMCFDLNAACSGFVHSMIIVQQLMATGAYNSAIIVGAEKMSDIIDFSDRSTSILFGDGVGLMHVVKSEKQHGLASYVKTEYSASDLSADETGLKMNGQNVFKFAVKTCAEGIENILKQANLTIDDIDYIVAHQANERILKAIRREFKVKEDKVLSIIESTANTSSASIPMVLSKHNLDLAKPGKIIFVAFGAGLITSAYLYDKGEQ